MAALALAACGTIGCAQSGSSSTGAQQASTEEPGPAMQDTHEVSGPEMLVFAALNHLDLKPEQRAAVEKAFQAVGPRHSAELFVEVAAEVRAGVIDEDRVLAKLDSGAADRSAAVARALDTLHATLTTGQRRALVDTIGKHIDDHEGARGPMSAGPAGLPEHLIAALGLTSDQRASVERILAAQSSASDAKDRAAAFHSELRARLQTFADDHFDAAAFAAPPKDMREHIQRTVHTLAAVLPVLTPSQREALATLIEAKASRGG
jgi:Spy/CpxP family protein refolding chaperone